MIARLKKNLLGTPQSDLKLIEDQVSVSLFPHMTCSGIANAITNRLPFLVSRFGWYETYAVGYHDEHGKLSNALREKMWNTPGIFPASDSEFTNFYAAYTSSMGQVDILGLMRCPYEKLVVSRHASQALPCELLDLEPYYNAVPWSGYLKGRRVLVIHPFAASIEQQYATVRDKLFIDPQVLPEFKLLTLKSPQTLCGNTDGYDSWSNALARLKDRVAELEFDVAIVGCGAYGLPIGAFIKQQGKVCLHIGAATQTLFGIVGGRWLKNVPMRLYINNHWKRPSDHERPVNWDKAEEGCYW